MGWGWRIRLGVGFLGWLRALFGAGFGVALELRVHWKHCCTGLRAGLGLLIITSWFRAGLGLVDCLRVVVFLFQLGLVLRRFEFRV